MALLKKIIKSDPRETIIKWTGLGTDSLLLTSLVSENQTLTGTIAPVVNIIGMVSSMDALGACIITRNNEVTVHAWSSFEFQTDGVIQSVLNENGTFDIGINLTTAGTLILRVKKMQGYSGI